MCCFVIGPLGLAKCKWTGRTWCVIVDDMPPVERFKLPSQLLRGLIKRRLIWVVVVVLAWLLFYLLALLNFPALQIPLLCRLSLHQLHGQKPCSILYVRFHPNLPQTDDQFWHARKSSGKIDYSSENLDLVSLNILRSPATLVIQVWRLLSTWFSKTSIDWWIMNISEWREEILILARRDPYSSAYSSWCPLPVRCHPAFYQNLKGEQGAIKAIYHWRLIWKSVFGEVSVIL